MRSTFWFFLIWSLWISAEFLLGSYSHVRIHDAGDGLLPQLLASKIQFQKYGLSYFADYMAGGIDATAQFLTHFGNFNSLLFFVFPGWLAHGILMFSQRFIASYFTYKLTREVLKLSVWPSVIAGLIFSLYNFSTFSFTYYHGLGIPALPLYIYALEKLPRTKILLLGLFFGYSNYFAHSSPYLFPIIIVWFAIRNKINAHTIISMTIFFTSAILVQSPSVWALLANTAFSQRSIKDPTISIPQGGVIWAIFKDLLAQIRINIIAFVITLISVDLKKTKTPIMKKFLAFSLLLLTVPIFIKYLPLGTNSQNNVLLTFSFDRFQMVLPFVIAITAAIALSYILKGKTRSTIVVCCILAVMLAGSIKVKAETLANYSPYRSMYLHPDLIKLAKDIDSSQSRVATITGGGLRSSYPLAYGLNSVDTYLTLYPENYHSFWYKVIEKRIANDKLRYDDFVKWGNRIYLYGPQNFYQLEKIKFSDYYNLDLLSLANVKYVLSQKPVEDPSLVLLHSEYREKLKNWDKYSKLQKLAIFLKGEYYGPPIYIYENEKVYPRFFVEKNGQFQKQEVQVIKYAPDHIELKANSQEDSYLVATINYYPYWQAQVNGASRPVRIVHDTFMAIDLVPGENYIRLEYNPPYKLPL